MPIPPNQQYELKVRYIAPGENPMTTTPTLRRWLVLGLTFGILASVLGLVAYFQRNDDPKILEQKIQAGNDSRATTWPMFGGSNSRNLVNLIDKNIPIDFFVDPDT